MLHRLGSKGLMFRVSNFARVASKSFWVQGFRSRKVSGLRFSAPSKDMNLLCSNIELSGGGGEERSVECDGRGVDGAFGDAHDA
eukprot:2059627-Rhodomonas_salina.2